VLDNAAAPAQLRPQHLVKLGRRVWPVQAGAVHDRDVFVVDAGRAQLVDYRREQGRVWDGACEVAYDNGNALTAPDVLAQRRPGDRRLEGAPHGRGGVWERRRPIGTKDDRIVRQFYGKLTAVEGKRNGLHCWP
jgi:hypothetical protein